MTEFTFTEFRTNSPALLERVRKTKKPVRIMRFGKPLAEIVPPTATLAGERLDRKNWLGSMKGAGETVGGIVSPVIDLIDIEALRE